MQGTRKMKAIYVGKAALAALALAQVADVLSTNAALASGATGTHEGNPAMALAMQYLGPLWWLPKALLGLWLIYECLKLKAMSKRQIIVLSAVAKVYALTLLSNVFHWM